MSEPPNNGPDLKPDELDVEDWNRVGYWMFWIAAVVALFTNGPFLFCLMIFGGIWWCFRNIFRDAV